MFKKKKIAFSRRELFGTKFKSSIDNCFCVVSKMLFNDKINLDGTIDITQAVNLKIEELWSYIYYLHFYNHKNVTIFASMTDENKASAEKFYSAVISLTADENESIYTNSNTNSEPAKSFDVTTLIIFINNVFEEFGQGLVNPIFDYLSILMKKNVLTRLSGITIKTGDNASNKIKIVTDNADIANANVKFRLEVEDELNNELKK